MRTETHHNIYNFPDCRNIVICGDIHGDFNLLVNKVCVQYQMKDTLVIVAGDCGFGFECARESRCDPFANLKVTPLQVTFAKV